MGGYLHIVSPSLPSTPRKVPSGHGTESSILYLHSPGVRPKVLVRPHGHPLIQDSLSPQDYVKFYFIKYNYNSKDSHQDDVDPEEEELESS